MPLTFPNHPAVVLPLKLWRPRWFDGVALSAGAAAPDVAYALDGFGITIRSHEPLGVVWWGVPVALLISVLIRRAAPTVAAHLPAGGRFHLRDYAVLRRNPHPIPVTVLSALIGATSHLVADLIELVTHDYGEIVLAILLFGTAVSVAGRIGRDRLLIRWHGTPPIVRRRPVVFWGTASVVTVGLWALIPVLPGADIRAVWGVRAIADVALGLLAATAITAATTAAVMVSTRQGRM